MHRWLFEDLNTDEEYRLHINPNEGGSAVAEKSMIIEVYASPNLRLLTQGPWQGLRIPFSGVILRQEQDEIMEIWAMRQNKLRVTDDLGRQFEGVLSEFARQRVYRPHNPWYSRYQAEFIALSLVSASMEQVWGSSTAGS